MGYMGYDAIAIGEKELNYSVRNLRDLSAEYPLICSNLLVDGKKLLASSRVIRVGQVRVGVVSILGEDSPGLNRFEVAGPEKFLGEELSRVRRKSDILIVLAHVGRDRLKELVAYLKGVDLVIRGHRAENEELEESCVDTITTTFEDIGVPVFFAGDRGRVLGKIDVSWNSREGMRILGNEIILLSKSFREDTFVVDKMKKFFEDEVKRRKKLKNLLKRKLLHPARRRASRYSTRKPAVRQDDYRNPTGGATPKSDRSRMMPLLFPGFRVGAQGFRRA